MIDLNKIEDEVNFSYESFNNILQDVYENYPNLFNERQTLINHIAQEATMDDYKNIENASMKVDLLTDRMIEKAGLQEVTSPIYFNKHDIPHPDGLFSEFIFGTTQEERSKTLAYINLKHKFFHPYIYEQILRVDGKIAEVASGNGSWIIEGGKLKKDPNEENIFNNVNTGLQWLIENFHKIKFERNESLQRSQRLDLIESSLKDGSIFITKYIIIPIFYRDRENGSKQVPEINDMYSKIISYASSIGKSTVIFESNTTDFRIQNALVDIRKYGQSLIAKKNGFFHKNVLGKSQDYGSRSVISVPMMNNATKPSELPIDMEHSGIPLAQCISLATPFVKNRLMNFFTETFEGAGTKMLAAYKDKDGKIGYKYVKLSNALEYYSNDAIDKRLDRYINSLETRFDPIYIPTDEPEDYYMPARGTIETNNGSVNMERFFTWTDLLYLVCCEVLADKHVYICRYPISDYLSMFPTKIHVLSTVKTVPVKIRGIVGTDDYEYYPYYPVVNPNASPEEINTLFIDTITMSNTYLATLGADYDGDTISARMLFTKEANDEAEALINNIKNYFSLDGNMVRKIGNEAYLTFYNMSIY